MWRKLRALRRPRRRSSGEGRPWPLLLFVLALIFGLFAIGLSLRHAAGDDPAARDHTTNAAPQRPDTAPRAVHAKAKKRSRTTARAFSSASATKAVAGTPYAAEMKSNTHQRALVRKSLAAIAQMQQSTTAQTGKPSAELTKLTSQLHARDKKLAARQTQLITSARSWKSKHVTTKIPAMPPYSLTSKDVPTTTTSKKTGKTSTPPSLADLIAALGTGSGSTTTSAATDPAGVSATDLVCAVAPATAGCGGAQATTSDPNAAASAQQPVMCPLSISGQDAGTAGQDTGSSSSCQPCPLRLPLTTTGYTTGTTPQDGTTASASPQICLTSASTPVTSGSTAYTGYTTPAASVSALAQAPQLCLISPDAGSATTPHCIPCPDVTTQLQNDSGDLTKLTPAEALSRLCLSLQTNDYSSTQPDTTGGLTDTTGRLTGTTGSQTDFTGGLIGTATSQTDTTGGLTDTSGQSQQLFLCPSSDASTYVPCAPCPATQPLSSAQGQNAIPLCLLNTVPQTQNSATANSATQSPGTVAPTAQYQSTTDPAAQNQTVPQTATSAPSTTQPPASNSEDTNDDHDHGHHSDDGR
jgi:hypothetical protein